MRFSSISKFDIDDRLRVRMPLYKSRDSVSFSGDIQIVRDAGFILRGHQYGCKFVGMSEQDKAYLQECFKNLRNDDMSYHRYC